MLQGLNCFTRVFIGFVGIGCLLTSQTIQAAQISDLYEAEIPVSSQSRADRHVAIQQAFAEVLVRVSGQQDVVLALPPLMDTDVPVTQTPNQEPTNLVLVGKTPEIVTALNKATYYVKQFRYQQPTDRPHIDWGIEPLADNKTKKSKPVQQVLWIRFNKKKVNKLLHKSGLPVWSKTRPSILVWMVVENSSRRYLLSNTIKSTTGDAIEKHARLYGLPIRFPLMDLADRANISTSDVWGNFEDRILQASKRYQTESVLVGKLYLANRLWNTKWSLYINGRKVDWAARDIHLDKVVQQGLSRTAQNLALAFADVKTEQGIQNVLLEVKDLKGLADYVQAVKYLSSISSVKKVQTLKLNKTSVIFNLTTRGSRVGVMQAISLDNQLVAEPNTIPKQAAVLSDTRVITDSPIAKDTSGIQATTKNQPELIPDLIPDLIYRLLR